MSEPCPTAATEATELAGKIALELVYAQAGKDDGLLPVSSLLTQLDECLRGCKAPESLVAGVARARSWIDAVFGRSGLFDVDTLEGLGQWAQWIQSALVDWTRGVVPAGLPTECGSAAEGGPKAVAAAKLEPMVTEEEEPLVLNLEHDAELLREFINESEEHLHNIEMGVLTLEEHPTDTDTLNSIFRAFHTFKGGSGFLNLRPIQTLAHELESLLDRARQHRLTIDSRVINVILEGGDALKRFVQQIGLQLEGQGGDEPIRVPTAPLLRRTRDLLEEESSAPEGTEVAVSRLAEEASRVPAEPAVSAAAEKPAGAPAEAGTGEPRVGPITRSAVKVDTGKLDGLVDLVGEMVIAQSLVIQDEDLHVHQNQRLARNLAQLTRITRDLQRIATSLRMVPIRSTFQKMNRLVRDLSVKAGKQVELRLEGEETEIDRTIVEELSDPLIHMMRNSVDHGIEPADVRLAAGKPPYGTVWLRAFHQGGNIVVEVEDDGAGLNCERILAKAIEKGLVPPQANPSEKEIFDLVFMAGFSTAEKVSSLSGRGVGMDVVRQNIERLRGKIETRSTLGKGTAFTLHLPLTLAIIEGLLVGIGEERFILPTLSVRESFRPRPGMISRVCSGAELVDVRGQLIPLLRLDRRFGVTARETEATDAIVIVVEAGNQRRCLLVDQLLGKQEVVIKGLGELFRSSEGLAGAAILGDGRVGLILDVDALVRPSEPMVSHAA